MKEIIKMFVLIGCFIGSSLFAADSSEGTTVNVYQNENEPSAPAGGFFPWLEFLPWTGPGVYYGQWYDDEPSYHNDINYSRSVQVNEYDHNQRNRNNTWDHNHQNWNRDGTHHDGSHQKGGHSGNRHGGQHHKKNKGN